MDYNKYFEAIGYKYIKKYHKLIVEDFQRHVFPGQPDEVDGIVGDKTTAKILFYNSKTFCPEVFEPIKPYVDYNDVEIEALMQPNLIGLGAVFNRCAKDNDFDVLHSIAHSVLEASEKGKWANSYIARTKKNIYGWAAFDSSPVSSANKFKSFAECIEKWSKWFNKEYLSPGGDWYNGNNEHGVNVRYASSPIAGVNKSFQVRYLRNKLQKAIKH
jgi:beta-N-acetylglucosaminidase